MAAQLPAGPSWFKSSDVMPGILALMILYFERILVFEVVAAEF